MPRRKKKTEEEIDIDKNIGPIGDFATPKPLDEIPKEDLEPKENEEAEPEIEPEETQGGIGEIPPDQLREKFQEIIVQIASRGLSDEEKAKLSNNFMFWNGIVWEILDIGDNLKATLENVHVKMSPTKAMLLYLGGTGAMVFALRPDLLKKLVQRKKGQIVREEPVATPETNKENKPPEEKTPPAQG